MALRHVCKLLRNGVASKFPTMEMQVQRCGRYARCIRQGAVLPVQAVGGFFFLRFLCPALSIPEVRIAGEARRSVRGARVPADHGAGSRFDG